MYRETSISTPVANRSVGIASPRHRDIDTSGLARVDQVQICTTRAHNKCRAYKPERVRQQSHCAKDPCRALQDLPGPYQHRAYRGIFPGHSRPSRQDRPFQGDRPCPDHSTVRDGSRQGGLRGRIRPDHRHARLETRPRGRNGCPSVGARRGEERTARSVRPDSAAGARHPPLRALWECPPRQRAPLPADRLHSAHAPDPVAVSSLRTRTIRKCCESMRGECATCESAPPFHAIPRRWRSITAHTLALSFSASRRRSALLHECSISARAITLWAGGGKGVRERAHACVCGREARHIFACFSLMSSARTHLIWTGTRVGMVALHMPVHLSGFKRRASWRGF